MDNECNEVDKSSDTTTNNVPCSSKETIVATNTETKNGKRKFISFPMLANQMTQAEIKGGVFRNGSSRATDRDLEEFGQTLDIFPVKTPPPL